MTRGPRSASAEGRAGPLADSSPTAVVAAGDGETRVLLRSLLKLHHVRVEGEAAGTSQAIDLVQRHRPSLVLADTELTDGSWTELLAASRAHASPSRFVLVSPRALSPGAVADGHAPDAVLVRPFRIRAFADALGPVALERRSIS